MKQQLKSVTWLLAAALVIVLASACGPATPPAPEQEEAPTSESEAATEEETAGESEDVFDAQLPTAEPLEAVVLEGAEVTDSGLQYLEKVAGEGAAPESGDIVMVHFIGTLADGTEFANTYSTDQPATLIYGRNQLQLPGLEEAIGMMQEGEEARVVIPPELGFGDQPVGSIPPNSELVFDLELVSVEAPPEAPPVDEDQLETTDSGLQYVDLEEGEGDMPEAGSTVTTDFTIWVRDDEGERFVASSQDSQPLTFVLGQLDIVFAGWDEGVSTMQPGGKRLLIIPPELGLGETGAGDIPPNATLMMEVELIDVVPPPEPIEMEEVDPEDYEETASGLQYYDVVEGDGPSPEEGQLVTVHYTGWLEDGTQFDSSVQRGEPFTFPLGQGEVIQGWDEGVATMKVGGKRQLVIPSDLAYGEQGRPGIPPDSTLIFDVELLDIAE